MKEPVLLMTATISPQDTAYLKLTNAEERLKQYIDSLKYYIMKTEIKYIVFGENSNYFFEKDELLNLAEKYKKKLEIIQFTGTPQKIANHGKGYGEGEIIKYVLENSCILKKADYFIKVTGRIKVINLDNIINKLNTSKIYFNKSINEYQAVDTVLFCIPKGIYVKWFLNSYQRVWDRKGKYIEHVFSNVLKKNALAYSNIPYYPNIKGISGTVGVQYQQNLQIEKKVYNLLSTANVFNCNCFYNVIFYAYKKKRKIK